MECESCKEKDARISYLESKYKARYETRKAYQRAYVLGKTNAKRAEVIERRGGKCEKCGSTENLRFVHIKPIKNKRGIESSWTIAKDKLEEELKKCNLLCDLCRKEKKILDEEKAAERRRRANIRRRERAYKELYPDE